MNKKHDIISQLYRNATTNLVLGHCNIYERGRIISAAETIG